jgi:hypothetical protein
VSARRSRSCSTAAAPSSTAGPSRPTRALCAGAHHASESPPARLQRYSASARIMRSPEIRQFPVKHAPHTRVDNVQRHPVTLFVRPSRPRPHVSPSPHAPDEIGTLRSSRRPSVTCGHVRSLTSQHDRTAMDGRIRKGIRSADPALRNIATQTARAYRAAAGALEGCDRPRCNTLNSAYSPSAST